MLELLPPTSRAASCSTRAAAPAVMCACWRRAAPRACRHRPVACDAGARAKADAAASRGRHRGAADRRRLVRCRRVAAWRSPTSPISTASCSEWARVLRPARRVSIYSTLHPVGEDARLDAHLRERRTALRALPAHWHTLDRHRAGVRARRTRASSRGASRRSTASGASASRPWSFARAGRRRSAMFAAPAITFVNATVVGADGACSIRCASAAAASTASASSPRARRRRRRSRRRVRAFPA